MNQTEGYLIPLVTSDNLWQAELLAHSIKSIDPDRRVVAVTRDLISSSILNQVIQLAGLCDDDNFNYFFSLLNSPFEKTIALMPDQILTKFNTDVWESLRGLGGVVLPKNRHSFSGEQISDTVYWRGNIENKSFGRTSNINAVYINKSEGADELLGFALTLCGNYQQDAAIEWVKEKNKLNQEVLLPFFPEYLWSEWVVSFITTLNPERIKRFDFVNCIDLSKQEMNHWNQVWSREHWSTFLNYWVTDTPEIKIENFIQHGLIRYQHAGWLTTERIRLLKGQHG